MSDPAETLPALMTAEEVATVCRIGLSSAYKLMDRLDPVFIGTSKRIRASVLAQYLNGGGDECRTSTDARTARTGGAGATTRTAKGGRSRRGSGASARRRKLRELSKGTG